MYKSNIGHFIFGHTPPGALRYEPADAIERISARIQDDYPAKRRISKWSNTAFVREGNEYRVSVDLPGYSREQVTISYSGRSAGTVSIEAENEARGKRSLVISVPDCCDPGSLKAVMADGVLTISAPVRPEDAPRKIEIG